MDIAITCFLSNTMKQTVDTFFKDMIYFSGMLRRIAAKAWRIHLLFWS